MVRGIDAETVIVESKLGILRDRVIVGGREFMVRRGRQGWRYVGGASGAVGRVGTMAGGIGCRFNPRMAPSRFGSGGATRPSNGADASTESGRCWAIT
jgi:hypothetical protein